MTFHVTKEITMKMLDSLYTSANWSEEMTSVLHEAKQ